MIPRNKAISDKINFVVQSIRCMKLVLLSLQPALLHLPVRHMHLPDGGWRPLARQIPERRSPIAFISRAPGAEAGAPMNTRATILSAVLLTASPLAARQKVDTIVMTNG